MAKKNKGVTELSEFKPRNKHLHDVLLSRPAGRMKDDKEKPRSKEKEKLRMDWKSYDD
jgi:hypothetical protein